MPHGLSAWQEADNSRHALKQVEAQFAPQAWLTSWLLTKTCLTQGLTCTTIPCTQCGALVSMLTPLHSNCISCETMLTEVLLFVASKMP
jgi:hypothetical protein